MHSIYMLAADAVWGAPGSVSMPRESRLVPFDDKSTLWEAIREGALTSAEVSPSGHFQPRWEAARPELPELRVCNSPERVRRRGPAAAKKTGVDAASQTSSNENARPKSGDGGDVQHLQQRVRALERRAQRAELVLAQLVKFDSVAIDSPTIR